MFKLIKKLNHVHVDIFVIRKKKFARRETQAHTDISKMKEN